MHSQLWVHQYSRVRHRNATIAHHGSPHTIFSTICQATLYSVMGALVCVLRHSEECHRWVAPRTASLCFHPWPLHLFSMHTNGRQFARLRPNYQFFSKKLLMSRPFVMHIPWVSRCCTHKIAWSKSKHNLPHRDDARQAAISPNSACRIVCGVCDGSCYNHSYSYLVVHSSRGYVAPLPFSF